VTDGGQDPDSVAIGAVQDTRRRTRHAEHRPSGSTRSRSTPLAAVPIRAMSVGQTGDDVVPLKIKEGSTVYALQEYQLGLIVNLIRANAGHKVNFVMP